MVALKRPDGVGSGPVSSNPTIVTMVDIMTSRRAANTCSSKTLYGDTRVSPVLSRPPLDQQPGSHLLLHPAEAGIYVTGIVLGKRATHLCYPP